MDPQASGIGRLVPRGMLLALAALVPAAGPALAQDAGANGVEASPLTAEGYLTPPPEVMDAVLAPRHEDVLLNNLDPSGNWFLRTIEDGFPPLAVFARRHYNLGAFQVDPAANRSRRLTTRSDVGYDILSRDGSPHARVEVPEGARVSGARWSPDGSQLAFFAHFDDGTHIYVADADDGDSRRVTRTPVLATLNASFDWTEDGERLVTVLIPEGRGPEPPEPTVPETPMVRVASSEENKVRTYFDLLEDPWEMRLVEYYSTGQLATIEVDSRDVRRIGEPGMIQSVNVSPDGAYFRVNRMVKPFSYIVPVSSAGSVEELWDADGNVLATLAERELREGVRDSGDDDEEDDGEEEKRGLTWRVDGPGMVFLQMEPRPEEEEGGDEPTADEPSPQQGQEGQQQRRGRMDRVMHWLPPFDSTSTEVVYETRQRIASVRFDETGRTLFLTRRSSGNETLSVVFLDAPDEEHEVYEDDSDDLYDDPGSPMSKRGPNGQSVVRTTSDGGSIYLSGTQYFEDPTENAPRPFVDRVEIRTGDKERIFESAPDVYESVSEVLDDDFTEVVVTRQSPTMVPDSWRVDLTTGQREQLTHNVDHTPAITAARREAVMITRPDGFKSRVRITLPAGYRQGTKLPAMFWFYPREYTEQESYDERNLARYNKNTFPRVGARSMDILTLMGYAVVDPDLPIVGEDGQMNDNYVQDLRNTLATVIDTLESRGWIDRGRLGIGGHSYGAFGTANAMVNTPFFKAGIAGDGNYNRSLTPVGFQSERRELWEAEQIYIEMSPFFFADRLTGALLMYHGMDDHNVGTHPTHSRRLFHALNALGKTTALYMYPYEDHGPATLETTLDLWARWTAWLDKYVKNAGRESVAVTTEEGTSGAPR